MGIFDFFKGKKPEKRVVDFAGEKATLYENGDYETTQKLGFGKTVVEVHVRGNIHKGEEQRKRQAHNLSIQACCEASYAPNKVKVRTEDILVKYKGATSFTLFFEAMKMQDEGYVYFYMDKQEYESIVDRQQKSEAMQKALDNTCILNNSGINLEKQGRIEDAIAAYEECIAVGWAATHAYDRLMILYHKRKEYDDELRVIDLAIDVFKAENQERKNKDITHLYDVDKYIKRREKVRALRSKDSR